MINLRWSAPGGRRGALLATLLALAALLAALPLKLAAGLALGLLFVGAVIIEPALGIAGAVLSVPIQDLVALPGGLTVTQLVVVLATGAWLLRVLAHPDRPLQLAWQWLWLVWLGWQLACVVLARYSLADALQQWARWVAAWLAFTLAVATTTGPRRTWLLLGSLLIAPTLAALLGIGQFLTAYGPPSFLILGGRFARAAATFGKPNPFGGYMNMAWPLAATLAWWAARRARAGGRWQPRALGLAGLLGASAGLLVGGLFASYSRGGWIGAVVAAFGMALVAGRRSAAWAVGALVAGLLVGLLGAFSALPPVVSARLGAISDNLRIFDAGRVTVTADNFAVVERMAQWQAGWRMWQSSPLVGIGPGNYSAAYPSFFVGRWSELQGHAHNYYIHTLAESGVVGLALYLALMAVMFAQAVRLCQRGRGTVWGAVGLGGCGIMLAVAGHNLFENLHVLNLGIQLSGVWAVIVVGLRQVARP